MGTCCETICKHRILFPSIQHLAWLPQGRPQRKEKCGKNSDFWTYALTSASYNSETIEDRWVHAERRLTTIELSFHPCNILRDNRKGVSRGNKNVGCGTWKRQFFALAVRITGKLLKINGYMRETICKHRILFPSIQHLAWLPQGHPQRKQKCGLRYVKTAIFNCCKLHNFITVVNYTIFAAVIDSSTSN